MQYLFSVIDDRHTIAEASEDSGDVSAVDVFNDKLKADGHWVYANGLAAVEAATVIDNRGESPVVTDGPFVESKELVGGFVVLELSGFEEAIQTCRAYAGLLGGTLEIDLRVLEQDDEAA